MRITKMKILDSIATIQTSESKKSTHVKFEIILILCTKSEVLPVFLSVQ